MPPITLRIKLKLLRAQQALREKTLLHSLLLNSASGPSEAPSNLLTCLCLQTPSLANM